MKGTEQYPRLFTPLIWSALVLALSAGFGVGAFMVGALAGWWPLGAWWLPMVQAHGHAQLFGWVGLFILAVGFYFLPRLRGAPLARPTWVPWIAALMVAGIVLRAAGQITMGFRPVGPASAAARLGLALAGLLEAGGATLALALLLATIRHGPPLRSRRGLWRTAPLLGMAFASFWLAAILSGVLALTMAAGGAPILPASWDGAIVHLMLAGFIVPMTMAFSVQTLPLFLRLPAPSPRALGAIIVSYSIALPLHIVGLILDLPRIGGLGALLMGASLLAFIVVLDVLTRLRAPWTVNRKLQPGPQRRQTRPGLPDYGEYGRFEWLVYSAYGWLGLASLLLVFDGALTLSGRPTPVSADAARHAIALGFVTLLIFGMAVRMLPGFTGTSLASRRLVDLLALLGNAAALARVLPRLIPGLPAASALLGLSGLIGWLAVVLFAAELWLTFGRRTKDRIEEPLNEQAA